MSFTPRVNAGSVISGILTVAVVGLIGSASRILPEPVPIAATQDTFRAREFYQPGNQLPFVPAVEVTPAAGAQMAGPATYQPVASWRKTKRWLKKNAPIVGGAGGGAVVGGLIGGGKGALIGGAVGGGGGYLYKRHHRHHEKHHHHHQYQQQHR